MRYICCLAALASLCGGCADTSSRAAMAEFEELGATVVDGPVFSVQLYNSRPVIYKQSNICTINSTSVVDDQNMTIIVHPCLDSDVSRYLIAFPKSNYSDAQHQSYMGYQ
jgi:hypothetical protein